jgi:hypothetical protein
MPSKEKQSIFRLTKEARKILERLAKKRGLSMTAVVETLIREAGLQDKLDSLTS